MACQWLLINGPVVKDKYVFLDQDGELWANPNILNVFILLVLIHLIKMVLLNMLIVLSVIMSEPFLLVLLSISSLGPMHSFVTYIPEIP